MYWIKTFFLFSLLSYLFISCTPPSGNSDSATILIHPTAATPAVTSITPPSLTQTSADLTNPTPMSLELQPTLTLIPSNHLETVSPIILTPTYSLDSWQDAPVIPELNESILKIFQIAKEHGNNIHAFSKIGDCGSTPTWFLGDFDKGDRFYSLGQYQYLEDVIAFYQGSFGRTSLAAQSGFNASSVLTPLWSDKTQCQANETPLACEFRVHKPVIAFITLGANDVYHLDTFEPQMRKIIEYAIDQGVIPILSTKPDNIEKNQLINQTIARLAYEYQIPLWNYWSAMQALPNHGLQDDGVHITWSSNHFDNPTTLEAGWPVRNLTALQVLDAFWRFLTSKQDNP